MTTNMQRRKVLAKQRSIAGYGAGTRGPSPGRRACRLGLLVALVLGLPVLALPYSVRLAWNPPTTFTDGSPATEADIAGYRLHYGWAEGEYLEGVDVGDTTEFTLEGLAPATSYWIVVTAYTPAQGESGPSSPPLLLVTPMLPPADSSPPAVTILQPQDRADVQRRASQTLEATASDNIGVLSVVFVVNEAIVCTRSQEPYACSWRVPAPPGRTYQIQAKAYDAAGNVGLSAPITVQAQK